MEKQKTPQRKDNIVELHPKKKSPTTLYVLLAIFVVGLCIYQVYKINYSPIKTEVAFQKTILNTAATEGFIVRDETAIKTDASGTLVPLVADGKRVASGDAVAVVFQTEDAAKTYARIEKLKREIAYFESLKNKVGAHVSDMEAMDERIYNSCENYIQNIAAARGGSLSDWERSVCEAITSRQLATGTVIDPTEKLAALRAELAELEGHSGGFTTIYAPKPGYYISRVDGYEEVFPYADAVKVGKDGIDALLASTPKPPEERKGYMGKLVDSFNWFLYCEIDSASASNLATGHTITVEFPLSNAESVEAEIVAVQSTGDGKTAVTLRSNLMNPQYAGLRREQVRLVLDRYTGFQISNRAIREVDGQKGVYIQSGKIIKFKKVDIAYSDNNYSLCVTPKDEAGNPLKGYVSLYDEVIVEGTDLYDGKVMG